MCLCCFYRIFARFLQGFGSCGTMVAAWAVVRDVFDMDSRSKMYSYINAAVALAPLLAPHLGGYLYKWFYTWRATFHFLSLFSILTLLIVYYGLNETKPSTKNHYNYFDILNKLEFWCYVVCAISALTQLFTFFSISPILLIEKLAVHPIHYGYFFGLNAMVYIIFSILSPHLNTRFGLNKTIWIGSNIIIMGAITMLVWHILYGLSKLGLMLPNCIMTAGVGLIFGACTAGALAPFKEVAGTAAAAYGFILYCSAALIGGLIMQFEINNTIVLGVTMLTLGSINVCMMLILIYKSKNKVQDELEIIYTK